MVSAVTSYSCILAPFVLYWYPLFLLPPSPPSLSPSLPSLPFPLLSLSCQVMTNIHGESEWEPCFVVKDVDLPTGYYLGMSAATGDLAGTQSKALTSGLLLE